MTTWKFLRSQYQIQGNPECSAVTKILISPTLTLPQDKRIAQAVVHFKPLLQKFLPEDPRPRWSIYRYPASMFGPVPALEIMRRGLPEAREQYIPLVQESRAAFQDSDAAIQALEKASDLNELTCLLWLTDETCCPWYWSWISEDQDLDLVARQPPLIATVADAIWWTEFKLSFISACMPPSSLGRLLRLPRTFEGLREFLSGVRQPVGASHIHSRGQRRVRTGQSNTYQEQGV